MKLEATPEFFALFPEARIALVVLRAIDNTRRSDEAELLRSGRSGLVEVERAGDVTIYEVPDPTPILTGPAEARLTVLGHDRVEGEVGAPGEYRLAVRWTPTWRVEAGDVCVREGPDG
jgi:hypothetical protein